MHRGLLLLVGALLWLVAPLTLAQKKPILEAPPEQVGPNQWRVTWESVPGAIYRLERSLDLKDWEPVDLIQAAEVSTNLVDGGTPEQDEVFWRVVWVGNSGNLRPEILSPVEQLPGNEWRITWTSFPGLRYILERSFDLEVWEEVETVDAVADLTSLIDAQIAAGQPRAFWRVGLIGVPDDGTGIAVSNVQVRYQLAGPEPTVTYLVLAGGGTIEEVRILDNGSPLGEARLGPGGLYSLTVPWDPGVPVSRSLQAVATGESGETSRGEITEVLLADPSRFVPLAPDGTPRYGQVLTTDAQGALGPFSFFPEGFGSEKETAGVHFQFSPGARFESAAGTTEIVFDAALYFNGRGVETGATIAGAGRRLDIDGVTPAAIAGFFPGQEPTLCWGTREVPWTSGTLGRAGWTTLTLLPELGTFPLPGFQTTATATEDPSGENRYLVICFHGEWEPAPESGLRFEIPESDPLKIYLHEDGPISAHGTAQATFPDGGTLRGHLAWRDPEFEFSFRGRGIAISSLGTLRSVLPSDPFDCIPAGLSDAELDAAAACLRGYRAAFKNLALGSLGQAALDQPSAAPALASPEEAAFASLRAWAARAQSWSGDRAGEFLTPPQAEDLGRVLGNAAKAAEAAGKLATVLPALEALEVLTTHLSAMAGPQSDLAPIVEDALARVLAAAQRLVDDQPFFPLDDPALETLVGLELADAGQSLRKGVRDPAANLVALASAVSDKVDPAFFARNGFEPALDPANPPANPLLTGLPREDLLAILRDLTRSLAVEILAGPATNATDSPPDQPYEEAYRQLKRHLLPAHDDATSEAVTARDYEALRTILRERAAVQRLYQLAGLPLADNDFVPSTSEVLAVFEGVVAQRLFNIDPARRPLHYLDNLDLVRALAATANADLGDIIRRRWIEVSQFSRRFINQNADDACLAFIEAFLDRGVLIEEPPQNPETSGTINFSGKYESQDDAVTLQLNQAGRYLIGWLQYHQRTHYRLRGHFLEEDDDRIVFAYLLIDEGDVIEDTGTLEAELVDGSPVVTLTRVVDIGLGPDIRDEVYVQTSSFPSLSPETIEFFAGKGRDILLSHQLVPLHSSEVRLFYQEADKIRAKIQAYAELDDGDSQRKFRASETNQLIKALLAQVDAQSTALIRLALLQELSKHEHRGRTLREWLMIMVTVAQAENQPMSETLTLLGQVERINNDPNNPNAPSTGGLFRYSFTFEEFSGGGDVGLIGIGATVFELTVEKFGPDGSFLDRYFYHGVIGQVGAGPGVGGFAFADDAAEVLSPLEYNAEDIEGRCALFTTTFDFAIGGGLSVNKTEFAFFGADGLPAMIVDVSDSITDPSGLIGFKFDTGIEFGAGFVFDRSNVTQIDENFRLTRELAQFSAEDDLEFQTTFDFGVDESQLTDCGRQYLREFVAEHRALFANPDVHVAIFGFTDTTGTDAHNLTLSQQRADRVRAALELILGPQLPIKPGHLIARGLGEAPARSDLQGPDPDNPPWLDARLDQPGEEKWRSAALAARELGARVPDDTDSPDWRRVVIVLNGLVSLSLESPLVTKP